MIQDKKELREHFLKIRSALTSAEITQKSKVIFRQLEKADEVWDKNSFGVYLAFKNEVHTKLLIDKLKSLQKEVFLPRFFEEKKTYFFVKFTGWKDLEIGHYGILQPKRSKNVDIKKIDVVFIPGVAFDKNGIRLGWGTGTYDMLLKGSKAMKVGLAYDFQIADSLPYEDHDLKVDLIVTEKKIVRVNF